MSEGVLERYRAMARRGDIEPNEAQLRVARMLDGLACALSAKPQEPKGPLSFLKPLSLSHTQPHGLYIHGSVGTGKTMLMDLFYAEARSARAKRIHFHEFMSEVHEAIAEVRKAQPGDPTAHVAKDIAAKTSLLCFDELHVTDIADAMILGRLFGGLFDRGVVAVATSNAAPADLYENGLNRELFLPFVDLIERHMRVVELDAAKDFRLEKLSGHSLYLVPADAAARAEMDRHWARLTAEHPAVSTILDVKGRQVTVPAAAMGVARFAFADLCESPLGTRDYLHIAHAFHTVLLDSVPVLSPDQRDSARRFVNLVDTLYDNGVCLIVSAEAEPHALYPEGPGSDLFRRAVSRLMEMRSPGYVASRRTRGKHA